MQNKKIYISPKADVTFFECEDVITVSLNGAVDNLPRNLSGNKREFISVGSTEWKTGWKDGFSQN